MAKGLIIILMALGVYCMTLGINPTQVEMGTCSVLWCMCLLSDRKDKVV